MNRLLFPGHEFEQRACSKVTTCNEANAVFMRRGYPVFLCQRLTGVSKKVCSGPLDGTGV
jgi:hypothetical protein